MWPFDTKKGGLVPVEQAPIQLPEEQLMSLMELNSAIDRHGYDKVENSIKNFVDGAHLYQAYQMGDDGGNFFGSEFDIRATAGRIKQTYVKEPWIYASSSLIARNLASVPFVVKNTRTGDVDDTHPLNQKLEMANKLQSDLEVKWAGYLDVTLGGNFFLVFDETYTTAMQVPVELVSLHLNPQDRTEILSLKIWDTARSAYTQEVPYKNVVHFKYPNPFSPYYGLPLYIAASRPILLDRFKNEFEMAFYLRGATNSGVIETTEDINKSRMERLMRTFEQVYTGKRNWWRTIFLPKGAKWIKSGLTMHEMQHMDGLRENRKTILATIGVPPSQVGLIEDVNRATAETQERALWQNTITPTAKFIAAGWNNSYLVQTIYNGEVYVEADFSDIEALQGSLETKGTQAKSIENYFTIDEIREEVFKKDPLPDGRGDRFVAEIRAAAQPVPGDTLGLSAASAPEPEDDLAEVRQEDIGNLKQQATTSQERIERKIGQSFIKGYRKYTDALISLAETTLANGGDVRAALERSIGTLEKTYFTNVEKPLVAALERGFSFASSQSKLFSSPYVKSVVRKQQKKRVVGVQQKRLRFSETDQQAIDALKEQQENGQRVQLIERGIEHFAGFNETRTNEIMNIIAEGFEDGKTTDQIAANIRMDYGERYADQAFTVARTEVLTAISQGIKWNHDVLGQVFSETRKQWFHVGDSGSNPDARQNHADFEGEGDVPSDYKWGGILGFPRDPSASPGETINCRCTMVTVIPDDAVSNADVILENVL